VAHTAGTFATDLAADKWELIVDLSTLTIVAADQIAFTPAGDLAATDVQAALEELDSEKAAASHTHPSSAITDSTAAGRSMLSAATAAAQRTLLSLGALALLDTIAVTDIDANVAFSGVISPAALAANTNDWTPTGWATAARVRVSASSTVSITGFLAAADGDIKILENIGATFVITLTAEDVASSAANRLAAGTNHILNPGQGCVLIYDATTARWRVIASGMLPASSAQVTALTNSGVAVTPATAQAAANATIPVYIAANPATTNPFGLQLLHVREEQAANTEGGTFTSGAWRTRTLNTTKTNEISGASVGSNQITLPAGTYFIDASAPAVLCAEHKAKLANITDTSDTIIGSSEAAGTASAAAARSVVQGRFTIADVKVFELQHRCSTTRSTDGLGRASNLGVVEVYSEVMIWKVA
jgi:hypothetical protein